jgi:hypothetical protein
MLKLLDQSEDKLWWRQNPSEINGDNLNNVRRESSRHFRIKKREYQKEKKLLSLQQTVKTGTLETCI